MSSAVPGSVARSTPFRLALFVLLTLLLAGTAAAQEGIAVTGRGIVAGTPDRAVLSLGVEVVDPDARTALSQANRQTAAVFEYLAGLGVPDEAIRTTGFNLWRDERYDRDGQLGEVVYRVSTTFDVELGSVDLAGEALVGAVEAGATIVGGVRFTLSDPEALERRARDLAMADARATAEQLAAAAGVELGPPLSIAESGGFSPAPAVAFRQMAMEAAPVAGGQLEIQVEVSVVYAIASGD